MPQVIPNKCTIPPSNFWKAMIMEKMFFLQETFHISEPLIFLIILMTWDFRALGAYLHFHIFFHKASRFLIHIHQVLALKALLSISRLRGLIHPSFINNRFCPMQLKPIFWSLLLPSDKKFLWIFLILFRVDLGEAISKRRYVVKDWSTNLSKINQSIERYEIPIRKFRFKFKKNIFPYVFSKRISS